VSDDGPTTRPDLDPVPPPASDTIADRTVAARPSALRSMPVPEESPPPAGGPTIASAATVDFADALRDSELLRTRRFAPITIAMGLAILPLLPFLAGDPHVKRLLYGACVVGMLAIAYLWTLTRAPDKYTERRVGATFAVAIVCLFVGVYYFGIFSGAAAVLSLGIFFVGIGRSLRMSALLYLFTATLQAALAIAVIAELIPDLGLVTADDLSLRQQIVLQVALQIVFVVTYLIARATRTQLDAAVAKHDGVVRQVARRDVLLDEARQELERAMKIGGPGRYSGQSFGSFDLGNVIGRGAMGEVYEAVFRESGEPAAVKLLNIVAIGQPGQLARFYREANAAARLDSPHVVRLLEVGDSESPLPYLAMERLEGADLGHYLRHGSALKPEMVVEMVNQIARGLEAAARAEIVHRDIKPQNLFLAHSGGEQVWKILDFGVSKLGNQSGTLTQGHLVGTPMYMAPEQAQADEIDHRADIYALGAVSYRVLTGQPPFPGKDLPSILYDVVFKMPARPSELARLSPDVDRVLAIAMAKRSLDRFGKAGELAAALAAALIEEYPWGEPIEE
jgi:serine/threonine-protein kinase